MSYLGIGLKFQALLHLCLFLHIEVFLIYFLYNFKFYGLKIGGLLYQIFMVLVTILNILRVQRF